MKQTLLLILFSCWFINCTLYAQQAIDSTTYKAVVINYNSEWQVTTPEHTVYKRVAFLPDSLHKIKNLGFYRFNYGVTDYYINGTVMGRGNYSDGKRWGVWLFYHSNGQKEGQGKFDGDKKVGKWEYWRSDGTPLFITDYDAGNSQSRMRSYWNSKGEQLITDGNGIYSELLLAEDGKTQVKLDGAYKEGVMDGTWTYSYENGELLMQQKFSNGKLIETVQYEKGKKRPKKLSFASPIEIESDYSYLDLMEGWFPDHEVFDSQYPLVAYVLGYKVIKRTIKHHQNVEVAFYGVTSDAAADTLEHARPFTADEMPAYPGGTESMVKFFKKQIKVPKNVSASGFVLISFDVDSKGNLSNYKLLKGIHAKLDEEAMRVVKLMPQWIPAKNQKEDIPMNYVLPINF